MFEQIPSFFTWIIGLVVGACIGSFLTVVVCRLPAMLKREWRNDCAELNGRSIADSPRFDLALPRSHCPHCKKNLRIWQNIPLIGFLIVRGKCAFCDHIIGCQYAIIEWMSAILTVFCLLYWGYSQDVVAPLVTLYFFIALAFIDYNEQLLPDSLTLSLLWLGLLWSLTSNPSTAILGAAGGYAVPWLINRLFMVVRKKPGMGHGDFKCLAAIGVWVGLAGALGSYVLAAMISLLVTLPLLIRKKASLKSALPFGPFLCLSGWLWVNFGSYFDSYLYLFMTP
jgi:leader peptidase (prepilin peptidase) / N-methyltransferase